MAIFILQWISLISLGVAFGIVCMLLVRETPRVQPASTFLRVHHLLVHRYGAAMGIAETGAFATTLILTLLFKGRWILVFLNALAWICIAVMIGIWAIRIYPINKRVDLWEAEAVPAEWPRVRNRWRRLHAERAAFAAVGLAALLIATSMV